jgi:hypothetical protein
LVNQLNAEDIFCLGSIQVRGHPNLLKPIAAPHGIPRSGEMDAYFLLSDAPLLRNQKRRSEFSPQEQTRNAFFKDFSMNFSINITEVH